MADPKGDDVSDDNCMSCKRHKATISEGKARWCDGCLALVIGLTESPSVLQSERRAKKKDPDYRNRNAPGGAWDHSER